MAVIKIDKKKLEAMLYEQDALNLTRKKAAEILAAAKEIYLAHRVLPDHNDYLDSFQIVKRGKNFLVTNSDDTAFWVEFGAHADGKTAILGYAPLRRAIDVVASSQ